MVVLLVAVCWVTMLALVVAACRSAAAGDQWLADRARLMSPPRFGAGAEILDRLTASVPPHAGNL